jgi:DNA-binding GntR family transcriptional regulator
MTTLRRRPLRDDIHALLCERIVAGQLAPGSGLQDFTLAGELGVSRTPVREALLCLESEGLVETAPNRGFFVRGLSRREVLEIYPIVWTLECLGVGTKDAHSPSQLRSLRDINGEIARGGADAVRRLKLDMRWHQILIEPCRNQSLKDLLSSLKQIVRRYECIYMQDSSLVLKSVSEHAEVIQALEHGKRRAVSRLLEKHWRAGMESLLKRLDSGGLSQTAGAGGGDR